VTVLQASRSYCLAAPVFTTILDVTLVLHVGAVQACPCIRSAAVQVSHLQTKET
jgi:hypothetical protein